MTILVQSNDISAVDGAAITAEARTWKGTPYSLVGPGSIKGKGGDCSGSTWKIYSAAGFAYAYQATATFLDYVNKMKRFREIGSTEAKQEGDILFWPDHMAIFSNFANDPSDAATDRVNKKGIHWKQVNDMWSAYHPGGPPYGAAEMCYFKPEAPRVFRCQK